MASRLSFRVGRVRGDLRGRVWYLTYHEHGVRRRPRVGSDITAARQLAAQINAQLETGAPAALSFEALTIAELRSRWLDHHEHVLRSSLQTICRYRTATEHLLTFIAGSRIAGTTSLFRTAQAEQFVRYLRTVEVSPNGHPNSRKRPLFDKGVKFILECCRTLFHFAAKRRHLPPYAENPFAALELDRIPVETSRRIDIFSADEESRFLHARDNWQYSLFLTLMLTGLRPGELTHLLLPDDLDLQAGILHVCNKPEIGWQVKTRNERSIPLVKPLVEVLRHLVNDRQAGPVFLRRKFHAGAVPAYSHYTLAQLATEVGKRTSATNTPASVSPRVHRQQVARRVWQEAGGLKTDHIRKEFMRLTASIGLPEQTAPKSLRHLFATSLQEGNVDPLIRCELMGHTTSGSKTVNHGLGMTAHYTQTRFATKRTQLESALSSRTSYQHALTRNTGSENLPS